MMIDFIPEQIFEVVGTILGIIACALILVQVLKEFSEKNQTSLSLLYAYGWVFIYLFWGLYGIKFNSIALIISNAIAVCLQTALALKVTSKRFKQS